MTTHGSFLRISAVSLLLLAGGASAPPLAQSEAGAGSVIELKLPQIQGLEDPNTFVPADNPITAKKVELGRVSRALKVSLQVVFHAFVARFSRRIRRRANWFCSGVASNCAAERRRRTCLTAVR